MIKRIILLILIYVNGINLFAQINVYQDIFKGGVTGFALNRAYAPVGGDFNVHIEPGSSIRKAFLFVSVYNAPNIDTLYFNGVPIIFNPQRTFNNDYFLINYNDISRVRTLMIDVTHLIHPTQQTYTISALLFQPATLQPGIYCEYYLYIAYENPTMPEICSNIFVNNVQPDFNMRYSFNNLNPMDTSTNIGLAINASNICDTIKDGSFVKINAATIGLIGGQDDGGVVDCTGVMGCFYYQNQSLYGLSNDTPDSTMNGTDAIANIENYLNATTAFNLSFDYQSNLGPKTNLINQIFLTYTTPCTIIPVVVSSDTTICQGETVQLHASGGTKYEWKCLTDTLPYGNSVYGLSCKTCANPVFSGDSSAVYTVRVWNGDSCSVVRPVRVTVNPKPKGVFSTIQTACGEQKGVIKMQNNPALQTFYVISENGDTLQSNYQNIPQVGAGNYTAFFVDTSGCKSNDSIVTVGSFSNVVAGFTVTPTSGGAPLGVHITNTSQNAQNYQWSVNGQTVGNPPTHFDTSGTYQIQLVAWNQHPECADTTNKTVLVFDSLMVQIPNVFSPNNDGVNDIFTLEVNLTVHVKVVILNRWGNGIYQTDQSLSVGKNDIWNGMSNNSVAVTDGTYFYRIIFKLDDKVVDCDLQPCEVKKEGFVEVVR